MRYKDAQINFDTPVLWKRPTVEKLPKKIKTFGEFNKEIEEFKELKVTAKKEIGNAFETNIENSQSINELNHRLSELCDHFGKAIIPTNEVDTEFLLKKTNNNTLTKKLQGWCKNLAYNIPDIVDSTPYDDLIGKFEGVPAFVCAAGPSLKNNAEKLKAVKGKALIIAVDTSLRPLLEMGIVPDICVTHDANPNGCKFFLSKDHEFNKLNLQLNDMTEEQLALAYSQLDQDKGRLDYKYDTLGLFVNYCHPLTIKSWNGKGRRFYGVLDPGLPVYEIMAACGNYKMTPEKTLTPENKGRIIGGSSVGHVAVYVAIALGCGPISLLGLDLSYPGGKTYVEGASNQKDMSKQKLIDMPSLSGDDVKTNLSMLSYKMVFERAFPHIINQKPSLQFYNCTEDEKGRPTGILEVGAEPKPIDWVIDKYCKSEVNLKWLNKESQKDS